jgi:hypothetical protein
MGSLSVSRVRLAVGVVLAWVFSGGLRRKFPNQPHVRAGIGIFIQPHADPPPIIIHEYDLSDDEMD